MLYQKRMPINKPSTLWLTAKVGEEFKTIKNSRHWRRGYLQFVKECLLLSEAPLREKPWQVWEWVVTSRKSSHTANDVIFDATCNRQEAHRKLAIILGSITVRKKTQTKPTYLSVIDKKATSVSQTKDTFLQRNEPEIISSSTHKVFHLWSLLHSCTADCLGLCSEDCIQTAKTRLGPHTLSAPPFKQASHSIFSYFLSFSDFTLEVCWSCILCPFSSSLLLWAARVTYWTW